jgi:hypothetical protein
MPGQTVNGQNILKQNDKKSMKTTYWPHQVTTSLYWQSIHIGDVTVRVFECGVSFIVFGLTKSELEPTIYPTRDEHDNHYTTDVVRLPI